MEDLHRLGEIQRHVAELQQLDIIKRVRTLVRCRADGRSVVLNAAERSDETAGPRRHSDSVVGAHVRIRRLVGGPVCARIRGCADAAVDRVVALTTREGVVAAAAVEHVGAGAAVDDVVSGRTQDGVVAAKAAEHVRVAMRGPGPEIQAVRVGAGVTRDVVVAGGARDGVGIVAAEDDGHLADARGVVGRGCVEAEAVGRGPDIESASTIPNVLSGCW